MESSILNTVLFEVEEEEERLYAMSRSMYEFVAHSDDLNTSFTQILLRKSAQSIESHLLRQKYPSLSDDKFVYLIDEFFFYNYNFIFFIIEVLFSIIY